MLIKGKVRMDFSMEYMYIHCRGLPNSNKIKKKKKYESNGNCVCLVKISITETYREYMMEYGMSCGIERFNQFKMRYKGEHKTL